jgi:predicted Zn-dependent peptidase
MLTILAQCDPGEVSEVQEAILAQIAELRDLPISNDELAAAKHALLASYLFDAQTTSGRANAMGFYNSISTYKYDVDYISNFESVTPLELQALAQKYLNPDGYTLIIAAPRVDPEMASQSHNTHADVDLASMEEK